MGRRRVRTKAEFVSFSNKTRQEINTKLEAGPMDDLFGPPTTSYCNTFNFKIVLFYFIFDCNKEFLLLRYVHFRISASPVMLQFEVEEFTTQSKLKNFKNVMIKVDYRISNFGSWIHQKYPQKF